MWPVNLYDVCISYILYCTVSTICYWMLVCKDETKQTKISFMLDVKSTDQFLFFK